MHKLLSKKLKQHGLESELTSQYPSLCEALSESFLEHEKTLQTLEASLSSKTDELNERNHALKHQVDSMRDVQQQLEQSLGVLNATFDATGEMILVYDSRGILENCNALGVQFFDSVFNEIRPNWMDFLSILKDPGYIQTIVDDLKRETKKYLSGMIEILDGRIFEFRSLPLLKDNALIGRVWCFRDVTRQIQHEKQIEFQAFHDALTGLPNRALLLDRIGQGFAFAKREQSQLAVLFLDLDNFKQVNDTEGHAGGDNLLKQVAERIQSCLRQQDTLSRLGGDEFVVLLEHVHRKEDVAGLCGRLIEALTTPFEVNGRSQFIGTSIGIAMHPADDNTAEALIRKADMAMYQAKNDGKNDFRFYDEKYELQMLDRVSLENRLRQAISDNELTLHFQPKVDLKTMNVAGAEALIRWPQPDGSFIPPTKFISIAEQSGLIHDIGRFVVTKTCEQLADWRQRGFTNLSIALNLSSVEFQDVAMIQHIVDSLRNFDVSGENLIIELTESIFLHDKESAKKSMLKLRQLGVTFALDDFGKGYSSFNYLQSLPLQYLKIDKSFLQEVAISQQSAAITQTIIDIGRNLGLKLVAEGIEDENMLLYCQVREVGYGQGFYLHRPMTPEQLIVILEEQWV